MGAMLGDQMWIGGSPCSGKSTIASLIAASRNVPLYSCDDAFDRHAAMVEPAAGPTLKKVTTMSVGDRLDQPIDVQVSDVFQLFREEFPLILRDLGDIDGAAVVEGAALLPALLAAQNIARDRAVWIVPTPDFQRFHFRQRQWARELLAPLADPQAAFDRWMRRDAAFATLVAEQARDLGYPVITVDGTVSIAEVASAVDHGFPSPNV
jgi:2-phosphoglycerate kinase